MQIDPQTFRELEIFEANSGVQPLFESFALTHSQGGKRYLKRLFEKPLTSRSEIIEMQNTLKFLQNQPEPWVPGFSGRQERQIEAYIFSGFANVRSHLLPLAYIQGIYHALIYRDFVFIEAGCREMIQFLQEVYSIYDRYAEHPKPRRLEKIWESMRQFFEIKEMQGLKRPLFGLGLGAIYRYDRLFREVYLREIRGIVQNVFALDALNAMVAGIRKFKLSFPEFSDSELPLLQIKGLRHPRLKSPVANDLNLNMGKHFIFLTGPNMAGKTTFLRATALAVYLAHLGMGVPAQQMLLTVFPAMLTSLQNEDNLDLGYSYYYSEVRRVRQAAELIRDHPRTLILMDELFRGTNYEDARSGTAEVIQRVLKLPRTLFILSSHIYALGESLGQEPAVQLLRFSAQLVQGKFHFSYQLRSGVSTDTIGLDILRQEGVLELLSAAGKAQSS